MIKIVRKEDCTGCSACVDICSQKAITLETDIEGFWYPKVNQDLCINCGLCEKTCAVLHFADLKKINNENPVCFGSYHKDEEIRFSSTSGGLFSALANKMFDEGGFVAGAVYNEDFSVKHILTNKREDLPRLRSSKYLQSHTQGLYSQIKAALDNGEKVLTCGAPCQMASLRLYLGKDYENLIICDFICLCINSPKIFRKHLDALERKYGAKIISVQAKNKELGWRALTFKAKFANGKIYLGDGLHDDFTRGYMTAHCCSRPSCHDCKFKGFPRISDITLGDFWGIERVDKSLDNNIGTSVVLLNSQKGAAFFKSIETVIAREFKLETILPGNIALIKSLPMPLCDRRLFFEDLENLPFEKVVKKYFPLKKETIIKKCVRKYLGRYAKVIKAIANLFKNMSFCPKPILQFLRINYLRKNTICNFRKGWFIVPTRYTILDIHKQARIVIKGSMLYGYKRIRGSKMESRLAVEENGSLTIESGYVSIYYGTDILVFKGANLTFKGSVSLNQRVQIICMDNITIGDDVMIARDVVIRDNDGGHEIPIEGYKKTAPVTIGNHVWIGQGAMIMKGVTIGDGAIISAGAWVATNVKPNALVMGDPARAVKKNVEWRH
jgi:acetyltransferase-like isoleucine patch superfamily enzyme/coenzyme F420-reducing hydrogenase beta subunit